MMNDTISLKGNFVQPDSMDEAGRGIIPGNPSGNKWYVDMEGTIRIPLYGIIFVSGLVGNILVILTLARNRRLRIVTNVFLLNLAVSDLLLGVFCMPFTLAGTLLREFIFGEVMCKMISYVQGITVAVNAWTLVAISLERFYAVCEPLRSRRWQTATHACKVVLCIWVSALSLMIPVALVSRLLSTQPPGKYKCREDWPSRMWEEAFNVFLDSCLLGIPLVVMATAYLRIALVLRREIPESTVCESAQDTTSTNGAGFYSQISSGDDCMACKTPKIVMKWTKVKIQTNEGASTTVTSGFQSLRHHSSCTESTAVVSLNMNTNNLERRLAIKKRVICMLFVVVLEFFICWTPIYVINTISSFQPDVIYKDIGYFTISFFHLLSYVSSCCNPITYCFMNRNFRREFIQTFTRFCFAFKQSSSNRKTTINPILN